MLTSHDFSVPRVYNGVTLSNVALVTGSSSLPPMTNGVAAKLLGLIAENSDGYTNWVQIFDGYQTPNSGAVPVLSIKVAAGVQVSLDASSFNCVPVSKGIVVALSSTGPTFTAATANKLSCTVFWTV